MTPRPPDSEARCRPAVTSEAMAPDGDWGAASADDYEAVVAELRTLGGPAADDLDALATIIASLQAAPPVADREDWTLPDFVRQAIWKRVDAHIDTAGDEAPGDRGSSPG